MLNQDDQQEIRKIVKEELDEKIKFLPTKVEFFGKMDEVMGELKAIREEQTLMSGRQSQHTDELEDHETRIVDLEKKPKIVSASS